MFWSWGGFLVWKLSQTWIGKKLPDQKRKRFLASKLCLCASQTVFSLKSVSALKILNFAFCHVTSILFYSLHLIYNYTSVTFRYTKAHSNPLTHLGAIKSESLYVNRDFGNQPLKGGDSDCLQRGIKWDTRQSLKPTLLPYHHCFWPWSWLNKWLSRVNSQ